MGEFIDEEKQAKLEMCSYALGFTPIAVVKCAVDLRIADVIETNGGAMTHADLSTAVGCSPPVLRRIMRYLVHRRFFKQTLTTGQQPPIISYAQTPLSRQLLGGGGNSFAALMLLQSSPIMLAPWQRLSSRAREEDGNPFEEEYGRDLFQYTRANPAHSKLFDDGMSCAATASMAAILDQYPEAFDAISSLVDVGGGNGTALRLLVKACPWILRGVNFDLLHVVSVAPPSDGVEHVAGDMFDVIPKADAAFLMSVLHGWNDEDCIRILRKCKEAIPVETGKVMIVEAVIREGEDDGMYDDVRIALDMAMLAHTSGKERTLEEWEYILNSAGFTRFTLKHIRAIPSVIEAYP